MLLVVFSFAIPRSCSANGYRTPLALVACSLDYTHCVCVHVRHLPVYIYFLVFCLLQMIWGIQRRQLYY